MRSGAFDASIEALTAQWRDLQDALPRSDGLAPLRAKPGGQTRRSTASCSIDLGHVQSVRRLCTQYRVSPYVLFRTAFTFALHVLLGRHRLATWANFLNRTPDQLQMVDWCARSHIVVSDVSACTTFHEACSRMSAAIRAARQHASVPLQRVWQVIGRNLSWSDAHINIDYWKSSEFATRHLHATAIAVSGGRSWVDLDVRIRSFSECYRLDVTFNASRYDGAAIAGALADTRRLVCAAIDSPFIHLARFGPMRFQ